MHGDGTGDASTEYDTPKAWHRKNANHPHDRHDAIETTLAPFLSPDVLPVVIDANVLRRCVGPTAKRGTRMVLTSLADPPGTRVFCARHVIDDFYVHLEEGAREYDVPPDVYRADFESVYRLLLRTVSTDGIEAMLLPEERARLDVLRVEHVDDVPTATLAIAVGAIAVTMDPAPWKAVYGERADTAELPQWAEHVIRWSELTLGFSRLDEAIFTPYVRAETSLRAQLPPFPVWDGLAGDTSRDAALARACLYALARIRTRPSSAAQIAEHLPELPIGQTPQRIGAALRQFPAFFEVAPRQWQLGCPVGFPRDAA